MNKLHYLCKFVSEFFMKNFLALFLLIFLFFSGVQAELSYSDSTDLCSKKYSEMIENVILSGKNFIGTPYRYGGKNPGGFDCSGFVHFIFEPFGLNLPASSRDYVRMGDEIDISQARKGDFALFKGRNESGSTIGHVALVIDVAEDGSIYILHATVNRGVTISNMTSEMYYRKRYVSMRRIMPPCSEDTPESIIGTNESTIIN